MKNDRNVLKTEIFMGSFVRLLVITAAIAAGTGGLLYLCRYSFHVVPAYGIFNGGQPGLILKHLFNLKASGLIRLGILLLIAIPLVRVTAFATLFAIQRDWLYCAIAGVVCAVLLFSFFGGRL